MVGVDPGVEGLEVVDSEAALTRPFNAATRQSLKDTRLDQLL